jgi:hypothetical protein
LKLGKHIQLDRREMKSNISEFPSSFSVPSSYTAFVRNVRRHLVAVTMTVLPRMRATPCGLHASTHSTSPRDMKINKHHTFWTHFLSLELAVLINYKLSVVLVFVLWSVILLPLRPLRPLRLLPGP